MKKSLLASLWAITASLLTPAKTKPGRKSAQHYRALPETNLRTEMPVVKTPLLTEAEMKRVKERHRQRKAKRGY